MRTTTRNRILMLALFAVISCSNNHRSSVVGNWTGNDVTITKDNESISVPIEKYGYLNLSLNKDSSYTLGLAILKDIRVEKQIFGLTANRILIPAVYKSTRYGKWARLDSVFELSSQEGRIFVRLSQESNELNLNFTDHDGRKWLAILEPKD